MIKEINKKTDEKIPVTVLTGFLGSGKTTLLNRILTEKHGLRIAIIENEFGEIGIDNDLVIRSDEEIFEMNNGCICCTVRGDLIRILGRLMEQKDKFDHILIETTGLADPSPVAQTFFVDPEISKFLKLDGIVTLVDSKHVSLHIDSSDECKQQVAFADIIVLNKTDLVSSEEVDALEKRLRGMNGMANIVRAQNANVDIAKVLGLGGFDLNRALEINPKFLEAEHPYEWIGVYELKEGYYEMLLSQGPDPSIDVALLPQANLGEEALKNLEDRMIVFMTEDMKKTLPEETLQTTEMPCRLMLSETSDSCRFIVRVDKTGFYSLCTEHSPSEFNLRLVNRESEVIQPAWQREFNLGHEHDEEVSSVGIEIAEPLNGTMLNTWMSYVLQEFGNDIYRMKGILNVKGETHKYVFQGVHMLFDGNRGELWDDSEPRKSILVFIGKNLDRKLLTEGFRSCIAKS